MTELKLILIMNFCVKSLIMSRNRNKMCIETLIKIANTNILFGTVLDYEKKNLILIINVKTDNGFLMNSLGTKVRSGGCF